MASFYAGKYGAVTARGVSVPIKYWRIDPRARSIDTTNFDSPTDALNVVYGENIVGIVRANLRLRGLLAATSGQKQFAAPTLLVPGVEGVTVFCGVTAAVGFTVAANVLAAPTECEIDQAVGWECELEVTGAIIYPA